MKKISTTLLAGVMMAIGGAAQAANDDPPCVAKEGKEETAKLTFEKKNAGLILSYNWGSGKVTMEDGRTFNFKMKGLKLLDNGVSATEFTGTVFNLDDPKDFAGTYSGAKFGATAFNVGQGQMLMENGNGKCIFIRAEVVSSAGLNLSPPGPGGLTVTMEE
jgi:hypothetical protein